MALSAIPLSGSVGAQCGIVQTGEPFQFAMNNDVPSIGAPLPIRRTGLIPAAAMASFKRARLTSGEFARRKSFYHRRFHRVKLTRRRAPIAVTGRSEQGHRAQRRHRCAHTRRVVTTVASALSAGERFLLCRSCQAAFDRLRRRVRQGVTLKMVCRPPVGRHPVRRLQQRTPPAAVPWRRQFPAIAG